MEPVTTVVSLPVADLNRSLRFYRDGLGFSTPGIDGGVIAIELPNLSLFLIENEEYKTYLERAGIAGRPQAVAGACILSAAITSRREVAETVARAATAGGTVQDPADYDGSFMGYVRDPDGHVWELVYNERTAAGDAG